MLPTVPITFTAYDQNGGAVAGARVLAKLDQTEIYQGFVVPEQIEVTTDANGVATLNLWPNALGAASSKYRVRAWHPDTGAKFLDAAVSVPNSDCLLDQILVQEPYPPIDAAEQALIAAQGALAPVTAQSQAAAASAAEAEFQQQGAFAHAGRAAASAASAEQSAYSAATSASSATTSAINANARNNEAGNSAQASAASASTASTQAGIAVAKAADAAASAEAARCNVSPAGSYVPARAALLVLPGGWSERRGWEVRCLAGRQPCAGSGGPAGASRRAQ